MTTSTVIHIPDKHEFSTHATKIYVGDDRSYYMKFTVHEPGAHAHHEVVLHATELKTLTELVADLDTQLSKL